MQKSTFLNKNWLNHNIYRNEERMSSKGSSRLGKTFTIQMFSTERFFTLFLKIHVAIFEIFFFFEN